MSTFVGKVAIVTGGGSGIGEAAAKLLAGSGADVVVADFDEHNGERVVGEILKASGGQAAYLHTDVSKESDAERLVQFAVDRFGGLHAALNNAGIAQPFGRTHEQDLSVLQRVLTVNVQGTFLSLRAELRYFVEHGGGAIVNTASIAGLRAVAGMPAYAASKYAIVGMTRLAAIEYVHENIRVNGVAPGPILSAMTKGGTREEFEAVRSMVPMGRMGTPEEIATAVCFLLSDDASFITGEIMVVEGERSQRFSGALATGRASC